MQTKTNIIFLGTPGFVVPILDELLKYSTYQIQAIITQPDRPVGRSQVLTPSPVKTFALNNQIPVITPQKISEELKFQLDSILDNHAPTVGILAAYGLIIPQWLLQYPLHGIINIHPSLLPRYRGASPTIPPILRGEAQTGVSFMLMDDKLDHGPIIAQFTRPVGINVNREQLTTKLFKDSALLLPDILTSYLDPTKQLTIPEITFFKTPKTQDHSMATYSTELTKNDAFIPWSALSLAIQGQPVSLDQFPHKIQKLIKDIYTPEKASIFLNRLKHALTPWPQMWTVIPTALQKNGQTEIRVTIVETEEKNSTLIIKTVIPAGGNQMPWKQCKLKYSIPSTR